MVSRSSIHSEDGPFGLTRKGQGSWDCNVGTTSRATSQLGSLLGRDLLSLQLCR